MQFLKYNPPGTCKRQKRGELVNVVRYAEKDTPMTAYPEGAREKRQVSFSDSVLFDFIIPRHDYMLKFSAPRYPEQFWIEIVAYRLSCFMRGVHVPPAFAAYHTKDGVTTPGALIEWFYSYPNEPREGYESGGDLFQKRIPGYERTEGLQHNIVDLFSIAQEYKGKGVTHDWLSYWAKVLLFDVLIGNTDRHQDNWGIIKTGADDQPAYYFCPAFDNGTALGHNIVKDNFNSVINRLYAKNPLQSYVKNPNKAKHHLKWSREDSTQMPHFAMLERLIKEYPAAKGYMLESLDFPIEDLRQEVFELVEISNDMPVESGILSRERADFMMELIACRKQLAHELLEG